MNFKEVMAELKEMGTEQNRKIYARHGAQKNMFGVSFANLKKLKKKIKKDTGLAKELWKTGNMDAMTLATMTIDPKEVEDGLIDAWVKEIDYYLLVDEFCKNMVANTPNAADRISAWTASDDEWIGRAGWSLLSNVAMQDTELPDDFFEGFIDTIEKNIHSAKNRTREAMNTALISIGIRNEKLHKKAMAAAKRVGEVEVNHGETSCKTPFAPEYMVKSWEHKQKKLQKKK